MHRLPNQFHTPASQAQAAAGGGCTSTCSCCVITLIGNSILGGIYFANIKPQQERRYTRKEVPPNVNDLTPPNIRALATLPPVVEPDEPVAKKVESPDGRALRGFFGFCALPFALLFALQPLLIPSFGGTANFANVFIAPFIFIGAFALAHHMAGSSPLKGIGIGILWAIGLALAVAFEMAMWLGFK